MKRFILLDSIFQAGRSFSGAISAAYLFSKGIPISSLATLKLIQSGVAMAAEIPSGLIADRAGHRFALMVSIISGALSLISYSVSDSYWDFAIAESLLAICLAFWSGAYDAYAIETLAIEKDSSLLNRFFHLRSSIGSAFTIASGFLGGVLASYGLALPYLASLAAFVAMGVWIPMAFPKDRGAHAINSDIQRSSCKQIASSALQECLKLEAIPVFLGFLLMEIVLQPLIYFWQPWFSTISNDHVTFRLGSVYATFQVAIICSGILFAQLSKKKFSSHPLFWISCWSMFSLCMLALNSIQSFATSLIAFTLSEVFFSIGESSMKAEFNQKISSKNRASCLSFLGFAVRAGSLVSLAGCQLLLKHEESQSSGLRLLFETSGILGLMFCILLAILVTAQHRPVDIAKSLTT